MSRTGWSEYSRGRVFIALSRNVITLPSPASLKSKCNDEGREDNVGKSSSFVSKFFSFRNLNSWLHIVKIYRGGYLNIHKSWQKGRDLAG